jgi:hypothetical protein
MYICVRVIARKATMYMSGLSPGKPPSICVRVIARKTTSFPGDNPDTYIHGGFPGDNPDTYMHGRFPGDNPDTHIHGGATMYICVRVIARKATM